MGKKKTGTVIMDEDTGEERIHLDPDQQRAADLAEMEDIDDQEGGEFSRALDEISIGAGAVRLMVTRVLPDTPGKRGFVGEMTPAEFTLEGMRKRFGAGRYRVRCMGSKGYVKGGGTIDIAEDAASAPVTSAPSSMGDLLALLDKREADRRAASSSTSLEYARIIVPALSPIVAALVAAMAGNKGGTDLAAIAALMPKAPSATEMVTMLSSLKQMSGENSQLDSFVKMLEVAQKVGGKDGETNWMDLVREGLGLVKPAIEGIASMRGLPAPAASTVPLLPGAPAVETAQQTNGGDPMLALIPWLRENLVRLIAKAAQNRDPGLQAEVLIDDFPASMPPEKLLELISRDNWWEILSQFNSGVIPYRGWFEQLRAELIAQLSGEESDGAESEPEPKKIPSPKQSALARRSKVETPEG